MPYLKPNSHLFLNHPELASYYLFTLVSRRLSTKVNRELGIDNSKP